MKSHRFPTYLRCRPDSQFPAFRYTVPKDILPIWTGPKVICVSLHTADLARCRQLVADHVADYEARFQRLREIHLRPWRRLDADNASVLSAEVSGTLEQGVLENDEGLRKAGSAQSAHEGPLPVRSASSNELDTRSGRQLCMDRVVADLGRQAALQDYSAVDPFLEALLPHLHIEVDRTQLEYQSVRLSAMQALLLAHRKIQLRNAEALLPDSKLSPSLTRPPSVVTLLPASLNVAPGPSATPAIEKTGATIDELVQDWIGERGHNAHTVRHMRSIMQAFATVTQVTHTSELTKGKAVAFKKYLLDHGSPQTAQTKWNFLSAVFRLAVGNDKLEHSPLDGVSISVPTNLPKPRVSFEADDIRRIFSHPTFTVRAAATQRYAGGIAAFWLPLIACFSGARMEEIGQLKQGDFKKGAGLQKIDYFAIDNADGKTTKNRSSNRDVPLHPVLIRLGLLDYVASLPGPKAPLFPDLRPGTYGKLTANFSKWFGRFLRVEIGITDRRKTFHSFRHGFATSWRECGLPEDVRFVIDGHALKSVGANYGETHLTVTSPCMNKLVIEGFPL